MSFRTIVRNLLGHDKYTIDYRKRFLSRTSFEMTDWGSVLSKQKGNNPQIIPFSF